MSAMVRSLRGFLAVVAAGWAALSAAGILYARYKGIPNPAALPVVAAFLVAFPFYLVPASPKLREQSNGGRLPAFVLSAALLPYLTGCLGGGIGFTGRLWPACWLCPWCFGLWYRVAAARPSSRTWFSWP